MLRTTNTYGELGDRVQSSIIGNGSEGDNDLSGITFLRQESGNTGQGKSRAESAGHKKSLQNYVVEFRTSPTSQIGVNLNIYLLE